MPFYYDVARSVTTNGTTLTETDHLRILTVANQEMARVTALYGSCRFGTAGGATLRLATYGTASTSGSAATPAPRNPNSPAAQTTAFTGPTVGTTQTIRATVGLAQTGGQGGWVATEVDNAIALKPNGGATGNADMLSLAVGVSVPVDYTLEMQEN